MRLNYHEELGGEKEQHDTVDEERERERERGECA